MNAKIIPAGFIWQAWRAQGCRQRRALGGTGAAECDGFGEKAEPVWVSFL